MMGALSAYLEVDPSRAFIVGFSIETKPAAAAFVPAGWIRKSATITPVTINPNSARKDVGRIVIP
jgi:hypothetical protein